jgi:DNA-damage-inducible protein J
MIGDRSNLGKFTWTVVSWLAQKERPFEPLVPNAETIEAIKAARRGELVMVGGSDNLLNKLNADG